MIGGKIERKYFIVLLIWPSFPDYNSILSLSKSMIQLHIHNALLSRWTCESLAYQTIPMQTDIWFKLLHSMFFGIYVQFSFYIHTYVVIYVRVYRKNCLQLNFVIRIWGQNLPSSGKVLKSTTVIRESPTYWLCLTIYYQPVQVSLLKNLFNFFFDFWEIVNYEISKYKTFYKISIFCVTPSIY